MEIKDTESDDDSMKKSYILHHDRLKPCEDRDTPLWIRRKRNSLLTKQIVWKLRILNLMMTQ